MSVDLALSRLLTFPDDGLLAEEAVTREVSAALPRAARDSLDHFFAATAGLDALERQRLYVDAFDFDRRASLHLTAHTQGDRRQRGGRLIDLKERLRGAGLELTGGELPDHLAVLLELRALSPGDGAAVFAELRPAIEVVRARLHQIESPYAHVLDAFAITLPRLSREERAAAERLAVEGPPGELVGLEPFAPAEVMPRPEVVR